MCEMTSMGDMSAARTTTPWGDESVEAGVLRIDLTTSLTPRLRTLHFDPILRVSVWIGN